MKIEVGKYYKTKNGSKVLIYATDGAERNPIHGAVRIAGEWLSETWTREGKILDDFRVGVEGYNIVTEWERSLEIEEGGVYRTKKGEKVRIYSTNNYGIYPVFGAIHTPTGWIPRSWTKGGETPTKGDEIVSKWEWEDTGYLWEEVK